MKVLLYMLLFGGLVVSCSREHKLISIKRSIYGSWFTKESKSLNEETEILITNKEQFFTNGVLISSKWFDFRDKSGKVLGEYYITKKFRFSIKGNQIEAKFLRCKTGISKALKIDNTGYKSLAKACRSSYGTYKRTIKRYKIVGDRLILGNQEHIKVYLREY